MITILTTDALWQSSPDEGDPECLCSRCLTPIGEGECVIRAWPQEGKSEYRYCERCQAAMGIRS